MSVVRSKRGVSEMEFLNTARQLELFTMRKCKNAIPKSYTFYLGQPLALSAVAVYSNAKKGNSIYPLNPYEIQMRRSYFLKAYAELESLASQIEVVNELCSLSPAAMEEWSYLIYTEMTLLKGVMEKDRRRYKNIE